MLPNARQSDPLSRGAGCGLRFLHLVLNDGQSDRLGRGAGCGHFLHPCQEFHASEICISYLSA